jgi:hypothetical protein
MVPTAKSYKILWLQNYFLIVNIIFQISNPDLIQISDFQSRVKPDFGISNSDLIRISDYTSGFV